MTVTQKWEGNMKQMSDILHTYTLLSLSLFIFPHAGKSTPREHKVKLRKSFTPNCLHFMPLKAVQGREWEHSSLDVKSNEETIKNMTHLKKYDSVVYDRYHCSIAVLIIYVQCVLHELCCLSVSFVVRVHQYTTHCQLNAFI